MVTTRHGLAFDEASFCATHTTLSTIVESGQGVGWVNDSSPLALERGFAFRREAGRGGDPARKRGGSASVPQREMTPGS